MAGAGFDARMIDDADRDAKAHLGSLAYVRSGAAALRAGADQVHVVVDGVTFFEGPASCVLVGNVPRATGGLLVFNDAEPDDGLLDVGVVTAEGTVQWLRVLGRVALAPGRHVPLRADHPGPDRRRPLRTPRRLRTRRWRPPGDGPASVRDQAGGHRRPGPGRGDR